MRQELGMGETGTPRNETRGVGAVRLDIWTERCQGGCIHTERCKGVGAEGLLYSDWAASGKKGGCIQNG